jgi:hypothetical protein
MHNTLIVDSREAVLKASGLQSKAPIFVEAGCVCWIEGSSAPRLGNPGALIAEGERLLRQLVADVIIGRCEND